MFPYNGSLSKLALPYAYSQETIREIQKMASINGLEIIPLVQTFGHLEFALKNPEFASLREIPEKTDSVCPSEGRSVELIKEMLRQVRHLHPHAKTIHTGADEAWWVGKDQRCVERLENTFDGSLERLKLAHISRYAYSRFQYFLTKHSPFRTRIAAFAKEELGFEKVLVWNDMFDKSPVELLREYRMHELVVPVVWGYVEGSWIVYVSQSPCQFTYGRCEHARLLRRRNVPPLPRGVQRHNACRGLQGG